MDDGDAGRTGWGTIPGVRVELPDPDWYLDHVVLPRADCELGPAHRWQTSWLAEYGDLAGGCAGELARAQGFVITRQQARDCEMTDAELRRLVRRGRWFRAARGVLATLPRPMPSPDDASTKADAARRLHALQAAAEALLRPGQVVSGRSAAILHGLPLFADSVTVELTAARPTTAGNRAPALVRRARLGRNDRADWFGVPVTSVARTLVDLARHDRRDGIVAADAALRERLVDPDELAAVIAGCAGWPGIRAARDVLAVADPRAESPLESITRLAIHDEGLPPPELQVVVGAYRVDMLWPEPRVVLEADGRIKYSDEALWAEKRRQERIERLDYTVVRVLWDDVVHDWPDTARRIRDALRLPPGRTGFRR